MTTHGDKVWLDIYECPACHGALNRGSAEWSCSQCHANYPFRMAIPLLIDTPSVTPGFLGNLNDRYRDDEAFIREVDRVGWEAALRSLQIQGEPDRLRDATAPNRVTWRDAASVASGALVIDVGAGTGGVACQLAQDCTVIAVDRSLVNAAFVSARARQTRLDSLDSIVADVCHLPIRNATADAVSMIGVLEWVPVDHPARSPRESQLIALREVRRVLKPGGRLFLGIENRYYFGYYLGIPEPHARLRYLTLMDHASADRYSRDTRGQPYLELTHSLADYICLLNEAGYDRVSAYWVLPDYRWTNWLVPADLLTATRWFAKQHLDPRNFRDAIQECVYAFLRYAPPDLTANSVADFGFVAETDI